jgi:sterol desaturase/sphingolipid hydroxylase (fatty acid hydroxylase superfamily)
MMELIGYLQNILFEHIVQPLMYAIGLMEYVETAFDGIEWFVVGAFELLLVFVLMITLERWMPAENQAALSVVENSNPNAIAPFSFHGDRQRTERRVGIRTDIIYSAIHRLGIFPLAVFFTIVPLIDGLEAHLRLWGISRPNFENWFPALAQQPVLAFVAYLVVLDFVDYWIHRGQHHVNRWWALHSLHHSQRYMTVWSDNRNHLLDDFLRDGLLALVALVIGIPPGQYLWLIAMSRLLQSFQHGNLKISFGQVGDKLLVSPWYHRLHHAIGTGHEGIHQGCNFAVLFPVWDWIFHTADWQVRYQPTGVSDQLRGVSYGDGFWSQQALGLKRLFQVKGS